MKGFFLTMRLMWQEARKRHQYRAMIHPKCIGEAANNLASLVHCMRYQGYFSLEEAQKLQILQSEMEKLILLTEETSFTRLSADRRMALYASIHRSHEKLLTSIQGSQSPTVRIQ